ncbi:MAG: hypothetical protein XD81_0757 [Bacteroidetes bacterium 38_7]|jgi:hypothetical protein|nr:MAG: hypothetical protein XD81_0757 [Bacteroidetes bacterium 38_7]
MKKKILSGIFALALLGATGYGVNQSLKSGADLSDLALMNVEALADGESGGGMANTCCPIWNVTVEIGGTLWPKIICSTGGSYKCQDCTCNS